MTNIAKSINVTSDIIMAFVRSNPVHASDLPELISAVHAALTHDVTPRPVAAAAAPPQPAVPVKKSVTHDYLICLEDGKKLGSLRRHLLKLGMTPAEYRAKWGLPNDYPMVAQGYSAQRSALAKTFGFGSARRRAMASNAFPQHGKTDVSAAAE